MDKLDEVTFKVQAYLLRNGCRIERRGVIQVGPTGASAYELVYNDPGLPDWHFYRVISEVDCMLYEDWQLLLRALLPVLEKLRETQEQYPTPPSS